MTRTGVHFGLQFSNIPLINLRNEFNAVYEAIHVPNFQYSLLTHQQPTYLPILEWHGFKNELVSFLLQRSIQGIECYVSGSVFNELGLTGRMTPELNKYVKSPFLLGSRKAHENYYHKLPALVHDSCSLKVYSNKLWESTIHFYTEIRNPLFHGSELDKVEIDKLIDVYDYLSDIYVWIDSWHNPERLIEGGTILSNVKSKVKAKYASNNSPYLTGADDVPSS